MAYSNIDKSDDYFNTLLWTGNGGTQSVTGVGFASDFVWIKRRNALAGHKVNDTVRGVNKQLTTNNTNAEGTDTNQLTAFGSDGFTLGNNADVNASGGTFVGWNWLGGGTASSNSDGSITSSVSANTTSGFSIVSYTGNGSAGSTVGHGLSQAPNMIISKRRSGTANWQVGHDGLTSWDYYLQGLDTTNAQANSNNVWNDTAPSSSFYTVGTNVGTNSSGSTYIAYCFHSVKGFSKFGKYTGNGNADGTFVYTGFKPAFIIIKQINSANDWVTHDNKRDPYNGEVHYLHPNLANAELTGGKLVDFTSNGFKQRSTQGSHNASGSTYIYMAFAESPLVGSNLVPNNAR